MKKIAFLLLTLFSISSQAQETLNFDTNYIKSENNWVAFPTDSLGAYSFGFIYADPQAGLTLDYSGTFKIQGNKIIDFDKIENHSMKYRLEPNRNLVAILPESYLRELQVKKIPEWLEFYSKNNINSTEELYNLGFMYNAWGECATAITYLEKAYQIDSNLPHINVDFAYSLNCLKRYSEALDILVHTNKIKPNNAYIHKEILYAQIHNNQLNEAIKTYEYIIQNIEDTSFNSENAYNIAGEYYRKNNLKAFNNWVEKTKLDSDINYKYDIKQLRKLLETNKN